MLILGIESSCDETGVALVQTGAPGSVPRLLAHALHSQIDMHQAYGGVVPELASRDHIRRVLPLAEAVLASVDDASFEVQLASSGKVVRVPLGTTVVKALADAGVEVQMSCEQGVCGTCLTRVLEGTPDHKDMYLTPEEQAANDQFLPCCSRSKSARLVLDL